ncbi:putative phiE125 gp8 family phage protein [Cupriavidus metallidurans]|jgi:uncharacterized phiE125 gp8 family phage protein|uniref:head-tail connector protein n=1 Tax=Cupriavidus TaxID=106589 RepID=UPI0006912913|nr:hypothetical protein [Cupriavidus metallidurans]KWW37896.1 hypothetical protein AU374_01675 [Cupriavidus metallidurans]MDE4918161.1 hypothetical protein [Cupriavidus metallidurans]
MLLSKTVTAAATTKPVSVAEVKTSARLDSDMTDLDEHIGTLIDAARIEAEQETSRELVPQTWRLEYSDWPRETLPLSPVTALVSVEYFDGAAWQPASGCVLEDRQNGRSILAIPPDLISALGYRNGARVRVTVEAGYETVPAGIKAWLIVTSACMARNSSPPAYLAGLLDAERDW